MPNFPFETPDFHFTEQEFHQACHNFLADYEDIDLEAIASYRDQDQVSIEDLVMSYYFKHDAAGVFSWKQKSQHEFFDEQCESTDAATALYDLMSSDYYDMITDWLPDGYDTDDPEACDEAIDLYLFEKHMEED